MTKNFREGFSLKTPWILHRNPVAHETGSEYDLPLHTAFGERRFCGG